MIADVILGLTIDTNVWIDNLKKDSADNIFVVDYDYYGEPYSIDRVLYLSPLDASKVLRGFDSLNFYKSLFIYPLYKRG